MNYRKKTQKVQAIQLTGNIDVGNGYYGETGNWLVVDYDDSSDNVKVYTDESFKETFELDIPKSTIINQPYTGIRTVNLSDLISNKQLGPINQLFPYESTCSESHPKIRGGIYDDTLG